MKAMLFNPLDPAFRDDPYPFLARLRREEPVHHQPLFGFWVLTRHSDVMQALKDSSLSSDIPSWSKYERLFFRGQLGSYGATSQAFRHWMILKDPPEHTRLRRLVSHSLSPNTVQAMRPKITAIADRLLDRIVEAGEADLIESYATPLPLYVIAELLGVPEEYRQQVLEWSKALLPTMSPAMSTQALEGSNRAMEELAALFRQLVTERRRRLSGHADVPDGADLIHRLLVARDQDDRLHEDELIANAILLVLVGHMTTVQLIASLLLGLQQHPDQAMMLRQQPELIGQAVEEALRFYSPLQAQYRVTTEPVEYGGHTIPADALIVMSLAAANRDPEVFEDPDRFLIDREARNIAFGYGLHFCIGAALARLEAEVAIPLLLKRLPALRLDDAGVRREPHIMLRGLQHMPISWPRPGPMNRDDLSDDFL